MRLFFVEKLTIRPNNNFRKTKKGWGTLRVEEKKKDLPVKRDLQHRLCGETSVGDWERVKVKATHTVQRKRTDLRLFGGEKVGTSVRMGGSNEKKEERDGTLIHGTWPIKPEDSLQRLS